MHAPVLVFSFLTCSQPPKHEPQHDPNSIHTYPSTYTHAHTITARALGPGHTVVTVLCDGGERYLTKTYQDGFLASKGLRNPGADVRSYA